MVISQVYGGGGNAGATYKNDFIELFNPGPTAVSLSGWSVQYTSAAGTGTWSTTALTGTIPAGGYYLVQEAVGTGGTTNLPTPENTGTIAMSATAGKVALSKTTTAFAGACPTGTNLVDEVSFGTTATDCGGKFTGNLANATAAIRKGAGCQFTGVLGDASVDFDIAAPTPRNTATTTITCGTVVTPGAITSVTVTAADATAVNIGATKQFTAVARDASNNVISTTFTWTTSPAGIATVDANGLATAVAAGNTTVTATSPNNVSGGASLTVNAPAPPLSVIPDIFISQVYGGGGNSGAPYTNDFVEIFNRGTTAVNMSGWAVQYVSASGSTYAVHAISGTIQPGKYFLVQEAAGTSTTAIPLPTADAAGTLGLSGTAGKVLLTQNTTPITVACPSGAVVVDRVAYGTNTTAPTTNCAAEWGRTTPDLSSTTAAFRNNDGCINTGNGTADFTAFAVAPRNSASPAKVCTQPVRGQSAATLAINELMGDPALAESKSWGQWFEVYNYGTAPIDLKDWTIVSPGTNQPDHRIASSVIVPAGGYAVLGRGGDVTRNGGVNLDYNYFVGNTSTIWLDNSDFLMMVDPAGARADSVAWTSLPRGASKGLRDASVAHANVDGPAWGFSTTTYGDGDYGTPDAANGTLGNTAPPVTSNHISISGRAATDAPLPVGFEAQLFATLADPNNVTIPSTFTWTSLTPGIASVASNGVIHALAAGQAVFRVTAADGTARNWPLMMETPVAGVGAVYLNSTEFGALTPGGSNTDFIVTHPQYTTSYNGSLGHPNWVAYDLNATHMASGVDRCNCFTMDPILDAAGFPHLTTADYTGAGSFLGQGIGVDRGHMTRSFDRTTGTLDNARTYYLSNVVPQFGDLNQGPWAIMENYLGDFARFQDKEVYIYVGPQGSQGSVKGEGKINFPLRTWKVAVIMPRGKGVADVKDYRDVEVVAAVMPNQTGVRNVDWNTYKVTVDSVEHLTGYTFLSALPANIQRALKLDNNPPIAKLDGPYTGNEGSAVALSGATSVDPNGTIVSYDWSFGDGGTASGATASHTYAQNGTYTVRLIVTDNSALVDTVVTTATIANVPPVIGTIAGGTILATSTYTSGGTFTDAGTADSFTATVDYGDGSGAQPLALVEQSFALSHQYNDAGTYTVTVTINDGAGSTSQTATVVVTPILKPIAAHDGPYTGVEAGPVSMSAAASVAQNGTITGYAWTFGDGGTASGVTTSHTYANDGTYTVRLIVTNSYGKADTVTTTATIANVAPVIASIASGSLLTTETYAASSSFTDPGADTWTATVNYGDGSGVQPLSLAGKTFALSHQYNVGGNYTVTVTVNDGGTTSTRTTTVAVSTLLQGANTAVALLDQLIAAGKVSSTDSRPLQGMLASAQRLIDNDHANSTASLAQLANAVREVDRLVAAGKITAADAAALRSLLVRMQSIA